MSNYCPACGAESLKRSRTRGLIEHCLKLLGYRAYRCKPCGWRGLLQSKANRTSDYQVSQLHRSSKRGSEAKL